MKTRIKHYSRSAISVLLSLCMLVSCMTVGLIATDAAHVTDSGTVSAAAESEDTAGADAEAEDAVGATGDVYIDFGGYNGKHKMYRSTSPSTVNNYYYSLDSITNSIQWKYKNGDDEYAANGDADNLRNFYGFGSNLTTKKGGNATFRWQGGDKSGVTIWIMSDLSEAWVTSGKTDPPTSKVNVQSVSGATTTVTGTGVSGSTTTINNGSNGNLVQDSDATISVTVTNGQKADYATVTGVGNVDLTFNGTSYTGTFKVPSSECTVTAHLRDKVSYKVQAVAYPEECGTVEISSPQETYFEDSYVTLTATPSSPEHPFSNWSRAVNKTANPGTYLVDGNDADGDTITIIGQFKTNYYDASATSIEGDTDNVMPFQARLFDYYYDSEYSGGWLSYRGELEARTQWEPYEKLNTSLRQYSENNDAKIPLYFGVFSNKGYGYAGSNDSTNFHFYYPVNDSNGLSNLPRTDGAGGNGNNNSAITGLSGTTLEDDTIHYYSAAGDNQNGAPMVLFDKDWLTSRSSDDYTYTGPLATIIDTPFPVVKTTTYITKRVWFDPNGQAGWDGDDFYAYFFDGSSAPTSHLKMNKDDATGLYYYDVPDGDYASVIFTTKAGWGGNKTNDIAIPFSTTDAKVVYQLTTGNNKPSSRFVANDTITATLKTTDYYGYDSKDGKDNAYFTGIRDGAIQPVMNYYRDSHSILDSKGGKGFLPFDGNRIGEKGFDFGFGMTMKVDFTLGAGGKDGAGNDQIFEFSGDDDLWVFVDGQLILDLGGAHGRTEGSINFATNTVSVTNSVAMKNPGNNNAGSGLPDVTAQTRNGSFTLANKSKHTMTIFYMERGKIESNLKFGFTFTPVGNELNFENKLDTSSVNEALVEDVEEIARANDKFTLTNTWADTADAASFTPISDKAYTYHHAGTETAGQTGSTGVVPVGGNVSFDDEINFVDQYKEEIGKYFKLQQGAVGTHKFAYDSTLSVKDIVNNKPIQEATVSDPETGNPIKTGSYKFDTTKVNPNRYIDATRVTATYTNAVQTKPITVSKQIVGSKTTDPAFTFKISIKLPTKTEFKTYALPYAGGTLGSDGEFTLKDGESITFEGIPVNAEVKVEELTSPSPYSLYEWTATATDAEDFTPDVDHFSFTVPADASAVNVAVQNKKPEPRDVVIKKQISATTDLNPEFTVTVTHNQSGTVAPYSGKYMLYNSDTDTTGQEKTTSDGTITLKKGQRAKIAKEYDTALYDGTTVTVQETAPGKPFSYGSSDVSGASDVTYDADNRKATFKISGADVTDVVTNNYNSYNVTITKNTIDAPHDYSTYFLINIYTSTDGVHFTPYTSSLGGRNDNKPVTSESERVFTRTAATVDGHPNVYKIQKDDVLTMSGVSDGTYVQVVEADHKETYYSFNKSGTNVVDASNIGVAKDFDDSTKELDGVRFQVDGKLAKVTISNEAKKTTVTVKKLTDLLDKNGDVINDGSKFTVKVTSKPFGLIDEDNNYSENSDGKYKVNKDQENYTRLTDEQKAAHPGEYIIETTGEIVFENVPKGTRFTVTEVGFGNSTVTGGVRFAFDKLTVDGTQIGSPYSFDALNENEAVVYNKVYKNKLVIRKTYSNSRSEEADEAAVNKVKLYLYKSGKDSEAFDSFQYKIGEGGTPKTGHNGDEITLMKSTASVDNDIIFPSLPVGTYVKIVESTIADGYEFVKYETTNIITKGWDEGYYTFLVADPANQSPCDIQVVNQPIQNKTVTVKKEVTNYSASTEKFKIKVETSTDNGTTYVDYSEEFDSDDVGRTDSKTPVDGVAIIKAGETLTFDKVPADALVRIRELSTDMPTYYSYQIFTISTDGVTGTPVAKTVGYEGGFTFKATKDTDTIVKNKLSIPYRVDYTYPSRFDLLKKNSLYGDQTYSVTGVLDKESDFTGENVHYNFTAGKLTAALVNDVAPFEEDFMFHLQFTFDDDHITYNKTANGTLTAATSATATENSSKRIIYLFPYSVTKESGNKGGHYYVSASPKPGYIANPSQLDDGLISYQSVPHALTTKTYTDEDGKTNTVDEWIYSEAPEFVTRGGEDYAFLFWSIREQDLNVEGESYVEVARCYSRSYNYATFANYIVRPMYECDFEDGAVPDSPYAYTQSATLSFLGYTRNQWNDSKGGAKTTLGEDAYLNGQKAQDMVYADFDLAFQNGKQAIKFSDENTKVGLLVENCGKLLGLEEEHKEMGTLENNASYLQYQNYYNSIDDGAKRFDANAVKNFLKSTLVESKSYSEAFATYKENFVTATEYDPVAFNTKAIKNSEVTEKNRYEYGLGTTVRLIGKDEDDGINGWSDKNAKEGLKNSESLYRAYSYMITRDGDVVISDPVYFTLYNTAILKGGN
ncbi:MAG: hypothetical protein ABS876_02455 [Ruminococcus sp.]